MKIDLRNIGRGLPDAISLDQAGRRAFLRDGSMLLLGGLGMTGTCRATNDNSPFRFSLITDLHYADKDTDL